jgi:inorganic pyrophosphatase
MVDSLLQKALRLEIEKYEQPRDRLTVARTHVAFSGSLQKHPFDPEKLVLIPDPHAPGITYLEFNQRDISYLEKLPGITSLHGETINMSRIWVRKNSIAVRCEPFLVGSPDKIP